MFERLPELLRRLRLDQNLTQEELSRAAQASISQVSRIEAGNQQPQLDTLDRLLQALGVETVDDFCRLYRDLEGELDPRLVSGREESGDDVEDPSAGDELALRIRPLLEVLPVDLSGAQIEFPKHVVYILPRPRSS